MNYSYNEKNILFKVLYIIVTMLIYFYSKLGQLKNGVQNTPHFFKEVLKNKNYVDIKCNNNSVTENINNLYNSNSLLYKKKINIGGDHSMSIATVADSLNKFSDLKVIWFDAHPDINTYQSSKSKNLHGMPLAYLTGLCQNPDFSFIKTTLPFKNLLYIGIRDIDPFEKKIIDKNGIKYINCNSFNEDILQNQDLIRDFVGGAPIHLSFDVDCLDPKIIPCTGTRCDNGLEFNQTKKILNYLHSFNIVNMDITELNLELGTETDRKISKKNILNLFEKYLY